MSLDTIRFADIWSQLLLFFRFGSEELFNHGDASDPDIVYDDEAVSKLLDRDQEIVEEQVKKTKIMIQQTGHSKIQIHLNNGLFKF